LEEPQKQKHFTLGFGTNTWEKDKSAANWQRRNLPFSRKTLHVKINLSSSMFAGSFSKQNAQPSGLQLLIRGGRQG
jgi:hypothetical protein